MIKQIHKKYKVSVVIQEVIEEPDQLPKLRTVDAAWVTQIVSRIEFDRVVHPERWAEDILRSAITRIVIKLAPTFARNIKQ